MNDVVESSSKLVQPYGSVPMTTSLLVAEKFGVEHKNILRLIRDLLDRRQMTLSSREIGSQVSRSIREEPPECVASVYPDSYGREQAMYLLSEVGVALVAMAARSQGAIECRREFALAFQAMRDRMLSHRQELAEALESATFRTLFHMTEKQRYNIEMTMRNENNWTEYQVELLHRIAQLLREGTIEPEKIYQPNIVFKLLSPLSSDRDFLDCILNLSRKEVLTLYRASDLKIMYSFRGNIDKFLRDPITFDRDENEILFEFVGGYRTPQEIWQKVIEIKVNRVMKEMPKIKKNILIFLAKRLAEGKEYITPKQLKMKCKDFKKLSDIGKDNECLRDLAKKGFIFPGTSSYEIQAEALVASGVETSNVRLLKAIDRVKDGMLCEDGEWRIRVPVQGWDDTLMRCRE